MVVNINMNVHKYAAAYYLKSHVIHVIDKVLKLTFRLVQDIDMFRIIYSRSDHF